jgi:hypothetical protein
MKRAGVRVGAGTRFTYDGEIVQVVEIHTVNGAPEQHVSEAATPFRRVHAVSRDPSSSWSMSAVMETWVASCS